MYVINLINKNKYPVLEKQSKNASIDFTVLNKS